MKIQFSGAVRTVTGSMQQVTGSHLKNIFLVHRELAREEKFFAQLTLNGFRNVVVTSRGDRVEIGS